MAKKKRTIIRPVDDRPEGVEEMVLAGGYSRITGLSVAKGLGGGTGGAIPAETAIALVQCETQAVRWRGDGVAPTATVGFLLSPLDVIQFDQRLDRIQFIEATAGAQLNVAFYKTP